MSFQQYFTEEHDMLRQTARQFVVKEILPFVDEWEEAGTFPRELYKKSAEVGICRLGYPEEVGGIPSDLFGELVVWEEMNRSGSGGLNASLGSHAIALPPIVSLGTPAQQEKYVRPVLNGERIAALAITEPSGGSDVARLQTTATRDGDHYVVNGSKTFITSGYRADQITCAVRTGGPGFGGDPAGARRRSGEVAAAGRSPRGGEGERTWSGSTRRREGRGECRGEGGCPAAARQE